MRKSPCQRKTKQQNPLKISTNEVQIDPIAAQLAAESAAKEAAESTKAIAVARGKEIGTMIGEEVSEGRAESLAIAEGLGADLATLRKIAYANRISRNSDTIKLPSGRYVNLSRGRGWCRCSDGTFHDDYIVGPGKYTVGSTDGFNRKDRTEWSVSHITVGDQTWTCAD